MHNAPQPTSRQRMRFWLTTAIGAVLSTRSIERRRRKSVQWEPELAALAQCLDQDAERGGVDECQVADHSARGLLVGDLPAGCWGCRSEADGGSGSLAPRRSWTPRRPLAASSKTYRPRGGFPGPTSLDRVRYSSQSPVQSVAETKQLVEREFSKPSPQLHGIKRLFFEAETFAGDGKNKLRRVWVVSRQASGGPNILLGYDGKRWTDPQEFDANSYDATSFSFARMIQLNDAVVFVNARGAHVFREDKWTLRIFCLQRARERRQHDQSSCGVDSR